MTHTNKLYQIRISQEYVMSSNPKIIVLKTREIIYTLLLLFLAILLIVCLVLMFGFLTPLSLESLVRLIFLCQIYFYVLRTIVLCAILYL